ncbi:MAG TPA: ABC-three component system middle component 2 [Isosphaeraceae bacterium]|jgi:hypothetical protein|nr:ABC-three component system middle component 2 [Isosphaeraceae bacterium]
MRSSADTERLVSRPEDLDEFRQGRLLLMLAGLDSVRSANHADLERLSYYDFFSANPFLVPGDASTRAKLSHAGFETSNLSYQSSSQRFANNRARLQFDLAVLTARGLVMPEVHDRRVNYRATPQGGQLAAAFRSLYADAFRKSASLIVDHLRHLSDTALRRDAKTWLRAETFMIDLYDRDTSA